MLLQVRDRCQLLIRLIEPTACIPCKAR